MPRATRPVLYQFNTRWLLVEIGPAATLDSITDTLLDNLADQGLQIVWLMAVWQTGAAGRAVSLTHPGWQAGFRQVLPDLTEADVCGSPFAIQSYTTHHAFGGD